MALTMKYVYQHRQFGFHSNDLEDEGDVQEALDPEEVRRLAAICKEKLLNDRKPLMETLRMQARGRPRMFSGRHNSEIMKSVESCTDTILNFIS